MDQQNLSLLAKDLSKEFPRSPRERLAGYVIAARMLDKCRAHIAGTAGDYHFKCPLDNRFIEFAEIDADAFRAEVAKGATDADMAFWIEQQAKPRPAIEVIRWNNQMRSLRICDLPDAAQEFLEEYIPAFAPANRPVYVWFDVYDLEEQRI